MATCRRSFGKKWGLKSKMVLWLYTMVVKPIISYASIIWWPKVEQATVRTRFDSLQRLVCLGVLGAMTTTPIKAIGDHSELDSLFSACWRMRRGLMLKRGFHIQ